MGDDGDALPRTDSHRIETCRLGPRQLANASVFQSPQRLGRLIRLIDDSRAPAVHGDGAVEEVPCTERYEHTVSLSWVGGSWLFWGPRSDPIPNPLSERITNA